MKKYLKTFCILFALTFVFNFNYVMASDKQTPDIDIDVADSVSSGILAGIIFTTGGFETENHPVLTETEVNIKIGETFDLNINNKIDGAKYKYFSLTPDTATISPYKGIIKGKSVGMTTIYCNVTLPSGDTGTLQCKVTVSK